LYDSIVISAIGVCGAKDELNFNTLDKPFIFILVRRHLSSTFFPYTTLFRSRLQVEAFKQAIEDRQALAGAARQQLTQLAATVVRDRKSTRLNSSHVSISYAVFCLKKTSS